MPQHPSRFGGSRIASKRVLLNTMLAVLLVLLASQPAATAFVLQPSGNYGPFLSPSFFSRQTTTTTTTTTSSPLERRQTSNRSPRRDINTSLNMFMGSDGGLFGVGAPEMATVLLVGYFVLGPSDLYKLTKEIGKFIQNVRSLGTDVTKTFETNLESQLELEELRKAQRELNDAFSFRRSINVDSESDPFSTQSTATSNDESEASSSSSSSSVAESDAPKQKKKKKKRIRRRKVQKTEEMPTTADAPPASIRNNIPDLDSVADLEESGMTMEEEKAAKQRQERLEKLTLDNTELSSSSEDLVGADWVETPDWMKDDKVKSQTVQEPTAEEQSRFANQLSDDWNDQILANEDKLSPLASVMERLALLEEEKNAADKRLEEEFRLRANLEDKYYQERRDILEEAAAEVQANAYVSVEGKRKESKSGA